MKTKEIQGADGDSIHAKWNMTVDEVIEKLKFHKSHCCSVTRKYHSRFGRLSKGRTLHAYLLGDDEVISKDIEYVLEHFRKYHSDNEYGELINFIHFWWDPNFTMEDINVRNSGTFGYEKNYPHSRGIKSHKSNVENLWDSLLHDNDISNLWFPNRDDSYHYLRLNKEDEFSFSQFHNMLISCRIKLLVIGSQRIYMKGRGMDYYQKGVFNDLKKTRQEEKLEGIA